MNSSRKKMYIYLSMPVKIFFQLLLFFCLPLLHCAQYNDTLPAEQRWYRQPAFTIGAAPAVMISYGSAVWGKSRLITSSWEVREWRYRRHPDFRTHIDDYMPIVPSVTPIILRLCGVKTTNRIKGQVLRYALSYALMNAIVQPIKYSVKALRPDSTRRNSFPSAHTGAAFVGAEFLFQELTGKARWFSVAGYAIAASVGALRILNNRHWLTDVLVGGGIGLLSTKLVYYVCGRIEKRKAARRKLTALYYKTT